MACVQMASEIIRLDRLEAMREVVGINSAPSNVNLPEIAGYDPDCAPQVTSESFSTRERRPPVDSLELANRGEGS